MLKNAKRSWLVSRLFFFKGTRLTVEFVLRRLGVGMSQEEMLEQYPTLKPEHLRAAMLYAADVVAMDESIYQ